MADFEPPSFSLGLDFFFDSEPQIAQEPPVDSTIYKPEDDEEEEFGARVSDSDPENGPEPPRVLKRLRRGPPPLRETTPSRDCFGEDEIEEFSSQEDGLEGKCITELHPPTQYRSICSSSKIPLHGCGAIKKSLSEWKARKTEPVSPATASTSAEPSYREKLFPKLTTSPLRRLQLIDSDSDDPSTSEEIKIIGNLHTDQSSKKQQSNPGQSANTSEQKIKASDCMPQSVDLWKDFCPTKSCHIPTPALDEICNEYFHSVKNKNASGKLGSNISIKSSSYFKETTNGQNIEQHWNASNPHLPAHRYFLHPDPRIRKLVHNRLPNFFPLGIDENNGDQLNGASGIDYMGQFGNKEPSKRQATQQVDLERSSKRGRTKANTEKSSKKQSSASRRVNGGQFLHASEGWVDPKQGKTPGKKSVKKSSKNGRNTVQTSSAGEGLYDSGSWLDPRSSKKDSGKQWSHSNGQSVGQWYTGPNGRKVYVNKNGQELTGQTAYRQYKKDRGGFSKTKRKPRSKKKKS